MKCMLTLWQVVQQAAKKHQSLSMWEEVLEIGVEAKRLTHASMCDLMDQDLPYLLLKLHRDDDAIGYIRYWMEWRPSGIGIQLEDPLVLLSKKGEWPLPCEPDCRLLDSTDEMRHCHEILPLREGDVEFPVSFCMVTLVIKLRHITVYRNVTARANAFLNADTGLPADLAVSTTSFLSGDDDAAAVYATQLDHANALMDFLDEEFPNILPAVLDRHFS